MINLNDKEYIRNLHYQFGETDKQYYDELHSSDKEYLLFKMIEHWERLLMMYKGQEVDVTSLEQLVDDKHIEKGVDESHEYYTEIRKCIETLHQLNSWYEDFKI